MKSNSILLSSLACLVAFGLTHKAQAATEQGSGAIVSLFTPKYGQFSELTTAKSEPALQTSILVLGLHTTFSKQNFLTGGRATYGTTKSQTGTSGSFFTTQSIGFLVGYGAKKGLFDFEAGTVLGMGNNTYSSGTDASGGIVDVHFLSIEPQLLVGFTFSNAFKVSAGGYYQHGIVHRVAQYGTELVTDPTQIKVGGTGIMLQISFGRFEN